MMIKKINGSLNTNKSSEGLINLLNQVKWPFRITRVTTDLFELHCFQHSYSVILFDNLSNSRKRKTCCLLDIMFKGFRIILAG